MAEAAGGVALTLYSRSYCHLCDDMAAALEPLRDEFGFGIERVDVDRDPALEARYGERVPVLAHGEAELIVLLGGYALERRGLLRHQDSHFTVLPDSEELLRYYANSIGHHFARPQVAAMPTMALES